MHIRIESIDVASVLPIGLTQLPSFRVCFNSSLIKGVARFVPASGIAENCVTREFDVEVSQESITGFEVSHISMSPSMTTTKWDGVFKVCGIVVGLSTNSEPPGSQLTHVQAGDAHFVLDLHDIGEVRPNVGDTVTFFANDVSLWDEAI